MASAKADEFILPIEWHVPEDVTGSYATNIVVHHTDNEFIIHFFEVQPPLVVGSPQEVRSELEQVKSVRANCVARVIVSPARMPDFINTLQENWANYHAKKSE